MGALHATTGYGPVHIGPCGRSEDRTRRGIFGRNQSRRPGSHRRTHRRSGCTDRMSRQFRHCRRASARTRGRDRDRFRRGRFGRGPLGRRSTISAATEQFCALARRHPGACVGCYLDPCDPDRKEACLGHHPCSRRRPRKRDRGAHRDGAGYPIHRPALDRRHRATGSPAGVVDSA
jgi:hypothetical protein